jgi:hypothetical protein
MTFPEAVEEILAIAIATYLDGQRRERLREAIELSLRTLDEWDRTRLGISQEQLAMLVSWAKTRPRRGGPMTEIFIYLSVGLAGCCVIALIQETVLLIQRKWRRQSSLSRRQP